MEVVERFALEEAVVLDVLGGVGVKVPEGVVIGEAERVWVRGRVVGGVVVAGASACVELQVKNHSLKKVCVLFFCFFSYANFFLNKTYL